jgi:predicted ferric reductase
MQLKPFGLVVVAAALLTPMIWLPALSQKHETIALFSQYLGMFALIAMALSQVIATRLGFVERIFGGLDRSYILHKWLGIGAMLAVLLHDTVDAEMDGLGRETLLTEVAETFGEISLYAFLILVVITIATFIPYHLWRWTHRLMGVFFAMAAFHFLFILKPFANSDPLGLYVSAFCAVGILAFLYKLAPSGLRANRSFVVSDIQKFGASTAVTMIPSKRPMKYRPGQFAFVSFADALGAEPHPFTISKAPDESGAIRMTIGDLGDFTHRLQRSLQVGSVARIEGPFGRFERHPTAAPEIWIAAGIGITPFVAWAQFLTEADGPITLFYCVSNVMKAAHLDELKAIEKRLPNFTLQTHASDVQGRIKAETITKACADLSKAKVYFCGPKTMRKSMAVGLVKRGSNARRFHYEEFEIRSGMGLRKLASWLLERAISK